VKKTDVLDLVESITPESETEAVEAAYETLTNTKGLKGIFIVNAAQKTFDLTGVSGMALLSGLDRQNLVRILLAARHGVFDFGALVFPRKTPDGKDEGTYTWPDEARVMAAIEAAYNENYDQIDFDALLPDPKDIGGKAPSVSFKKVFPKGSAPRKASPPKEDKPPAPSPAEEAAKEEPMPKSAPEKDAPEKDAPDQTLRVQDTHIDLEAMAHVISTRTARLLAPGMQRSFAVVGRALHAEAYIMTAVLKRQDEIYELISLLGNYLDPNFEETELSEAPVRALTELIEAARILTEEADLPAPSPTDLTVSPKTLDDVAGPSHEDDDGEAAGEGEKEPVQVSSPSKPPTKAQEPKRAAEPSGDKYTSEDLDDLEPDDIDLGRVDYDEGTLRSEYGVSHLRKIVEAFGETPGTPARGILVNRVMSLAKRDGLMN
jgi:hypothetical protein